MIEYSTLRNLVLEELKNNPQTQYLTIINNVQKLAAKYNVFPTREECKERNIVYTFYEQKRLNPKDELNVNQIIWDLIVDRVLTFGSDRSNQEWPFLRLTEFGKCIVEKKEPSYYDPDGYLETLENLVPNLDDVIKQYALEGLHCFKQRLFFASAVMFGAAAEKAVLLLLDSIGNAETDQTKMKKIKNLLERPNLPEIFKTIQSTLESLIKSKKIPYSTHQGSAEYLLSLFEMIRAHRNDSVHPQTGAVSKTKIFLTIQSFPAALEVTYKLIEWFTNNKI